ncbi:MAG: glycerophosphodiester phosphodiesterase [Clostridium sp.]|jgi:glycerophosphoryl diester phosphodiesterase|uniref:glycerophosphodiester phosphodiesterase n=1 Tax=Clostridium sp. TaxID=1506 RepID=UPI0025BE232E|nr:glycerophosphodiester phosphodiesterase [Clostridium sp.]MCH3964056.1 glycerophosphodiester phosphodiesterase [Clostridium sp.]MCI1716257.1 glycerophosphodiester phosphodiesterase [Clostridium sp.]MCI1800503.1 glycerophosphodiester phosphodiesterase [Clostridium sp.]MCI1814434.1 glycerophosphodiester phosphodiesterase [Clostridium sp.]MCI1871333.1 glycerophosphodiester phosphodiesterase [Clostridium sp.]
MNRTLNIAHRGFSGVYPENTMLAFRKAVEAGADGIETDLHVTKDGVIVVCHDETLDRTTSGTGFIKDRTYEYIRKLDAGSGEKIPSLDEILSYMKDKKLLLNLELKNDIVHYDNLEKNVIDKIYKYSMESNVILSSFNHNSMKRVKEYDGSIKTGLLYGSPIYKPEEYAEKMGADALHPLFSLVMNEKIVNDIKKNGILINTYTVNKVDDMRKLMNLKVDGIITNYPNILEKLL